MVVQILSDLLQKNRLVDTAVLIWFFRYTSMIWHKIQSAKQDKRELHVVFLDPANAFSSVPHNLLRKAFNFFWVPSSINNLMTTYF